MSEEIVVQSEESKKKAKENWSEEKQLEFAKFAEQVHTKASANVGWDISGVLSFILDGKTEFIKELIMDKDCFHKAFDNSQYSSRSRYINWTVRSYADKIIAAHPEFGDDIIKYSDNLLAVKMCLEGGFYSSIKILNEVITSSNEDIRLIGAKYCSLDKLKALKNDPSGRVRKIYYDRVGPIESLDDMLEDRLSSIRYDGIMRAPYGYEKLTKMTNEIARSAFTVLISKLPIESIPMLLANRNIKKNKWISSKVEERLNAGKK